MKFLIRMIILDTLVWWCLRLALKLMPEKAPGRIELADATVLYMRHVEQEGRKRLGEPKSGQLPTRRHT